MESFFLEKFLLFSVTYTYLLQVKGNQLVEPSNRANALRMYLGVVEAVYYYQFEATKAMYKKCVAMTQLSNCCKWISLISNASDVNLGLFTL